MKLGGLLVQSHQTNYSATVPDIVVHMNCDTILAVNLRALELGTNDEFIFVIKNYDYVNSPYVYIFRAKYSDMNYDGEAVFKVPASAAKHLKHNAFYTMAVLVDAFDTKRETVYKKLTDNGKIIIDYGAQDLILSDIDGVDDYEIIDIKLELISDDTDFTSCAIANEIVGVALELVEF
jgi:hypothetical protein